MASSRLLALVFVVLVLFSCAHASPIRSLLQGKKNVPVPCVMKYFNGFCYLERKADTCTFYSSPSYATFKDCAASTNMGKTLKCAEVPKDQRGGSLGPYADCLDAEPTAAGTKAPAAAAPAPAASGSSSYAKGVVPCVMKYYNGFCYLERKAETCNFYSSPSYATYKDCAASTNMGKTLKCAEVPKDQQGGSLGPYADCLDAEPSATKPAAAPAKWSQRTGMDIKGRDIACNGKAFCEICGKSLADVQKQCAATAGCKSFTTDKKCFWLKTSGGAATDMVTRSGFDVFVLGA